MKIVKIALFFLVVFFFQCCGRAGNKETSFRIGIDPNWYPLNLESFQPYVNGFIEEVLLATSQYSGVEVIKVEANWDSLFGGLQQNHYDAILSSLPPYSSNQSKYDFSKNLVDLGPVLVVSAVASYTQLQDLSHEVVGVVLADPTLMILQKYPEIIVRKYETVPELLDALAKGSVEGALLDRLTALSFVRDRYAGKLKIASDPLTDEGLRLVSLKGRQTHLMDLFERSFSRLEKQKKLQELQTKWQL
ncbi:MAG: transporter substrate-binding domain-containing protein [Chlamydiales bacterium]|nr:transporter substrate-binding domain-containing protein [Chlamydiales bacterium]